MTLPVIALGGVGLISVASNEIPHEMAEMTRAALNNDWNGARQIFRKFLPLMQANFIESSPMPVKAVLAMMGRIEEAYRLPMVPTSTRTGRRDHTKLFCIAPRAGSAATEKPAPPDTRPITLDGTGHIAPSPKPARLRTPYQAFLFAANANAFECRSE